MHKNRAFYGIYCGFYEIRKLQITRHFVDSMSYHKMDIIDCFEHEKFR